MPSLRTVKSTALAAGPTGKRGGSTARKARQDPDKWLAGSPLVEIVPQAAPVQPEPTKFQVTVEIVVPVTMAAN